MFCSVDEIDMSGSCGYTCLACIAAALFAAHLGLGVFRALSNRQFGHVVNGLLMVSGVLLVARVM